MRRFRAMQTSSTRFQPRLKNRTNCGSATRLRLPHQLRHAGRKGRRGVLRNEEPQGVVQIISPGGEGQVEGERHNHFHSWFRSSGAETQRSSPVFPAPWRLGVLALKSSRPKAELKTRAVQTLRDCRTFANLAKRLACGAFTAAFGIERHHTFGAVILISRFVRA